MIKKMEMTTMTMAMVTEGRDVRGAVRRSSLPALAAAGALLAPAAFSAQFQFATGMDYSQGDYGEATTTEALVVPLSLRWSTGNLSVRASIPYLGIRGPAGIAPIIDDSGGDRGSNSGSGSSGGSDDFDDDPDDPADPTDDDDDFADNRDVYGLGDLSLSATWTFRDIAGTNLYVDLSGRVRVPTGNEANGLGRGVTDYAAMTELGWDGARGGVFLIGGRRFLQSTATVTRIDGWQTGAGFWRNIGERSVFGVQANWRASATATGTDSRSLEAFVTRRLSTGWRLEVHGGAGLSDASADYTAGLQFTWKKGQR